MASTSEASEQPQFASWMGGRTLHSNVPVCPRVMLPETLWAVAEAAQLATAAGRMTGGRHSSEVRFTALDTAVAVGSRATFAEQVQAGAAIPCEKETPARRLLQQMQLLRPQPDPAKLWLGRLDRATASVSASTTTTTNINVQQLPDAVREKLAADLYRLLALNRFAVAKHRLTSTEQVRDWLQPPHARMLFVKALAHLPTLGEVQTDVPATVAGVAARPMSVIEFMRHTRTPPATVVAEGNRVPLEGLMELLAAARLLGDSDPLGDLGQHCRVLFIENSAHEIVAARVIKMGVSGAFALLGHCNPAAPRDIDIYAVKREPAARNAGAHGVYTYPAKHANEVGSSSLIYDWAAAGRGGGETDFAAASDSRSGPVTTFSLAWDMLSDESRKTFGWALYMGSLVMCRAMVEPLFRRAGLGLPATAAAEDHYSSAQVRPMAGSASFVAEPLPPPSSLPPPSLKPPSPTFSSSSSSLSSSMGGNGGATLNISVANAVVAGLMAQADMLVAPDRGLYLPSVAAWQLVFERRIESAAVCHLYGTPFMAVLDLALQPCQQSKQQKGATAADTVISISPPPPPPRRPGQLADETVLNAIRCFPHRTDFELRGGLVNKRLLGTCYLALHPESGAALCNLGNTLEDGEWLELAEGRRMTHRDLYLASIEADPRNSVVLNNLGVTLAGDEAVTLRDGRIMTREKLYLEALRCDPLNSRSYNSLGILKQNGQAATLPDGRVLSQVELYTTSLELHPQNSTVYSNLGVLLKSQETVALRDGRIMTERDLYVEAIHHEYGYGLAYRNLGVALSSPSETVMLRDGRVLDKQKCCIEAIHFSPKDSYAYCNLSNTLQSGDTVRLRNGREYTDRQLLLLALYHDGKNSIAFYNLGTLLNPQEKIRLLTDDDAARLLGSEIRGGGVGGGGGGGGGSKSDASTPASMAGSGSDTRPRYGGEKRGSGGTAGSTDALAREMTRLDLFVQAILHDPKNSHAYVGLASSMDGVAAVVTLADGRALDRQQLLLEAVACNSSSGYAYSALASLLPNEQATITVPGVGVAGRRQLLLLAINHDPHLITPYVRLAHSLPAGQAAITLLDGRVMTLADLYRMAASLEMANA